MEKLPVEINKKKKKLKNEKLRIASGDHFNSELESKNASRWSSPKSFKNCLPQ